MRNTRSKLLVTVAMAALIGGTTLAMAQTAAPEGQPSKTAPQSQGAPHPAPGAPQQHPAQGAPPHPGSAATTPAQPGAGGAAPHPGSAATTPAQPGAGGTAPRPSAQTTPSTGAGTGAAPQGQAQTSPGQGRPEQHGAPTGTEPGRAAGTQPPAGGAAAVQLTPDQRTRIKGIVTREHDAPRVDHPEFRVGVGVMVPRSVHVAVLPEEFVTVVPQYRGFQYVIVGDEILIIDPRTMEIVAVLPA
jgi:hypothetical protein